jgi:methionyl-tRNA formyltransferase
VRAYFDGSITSTPQGAGGPTHRNMPDDEVAQIKRKLAQGHYARFVD